jgi:hypothetical protein
MPDTSSTTNKSNDVDVTSIYNDLTSAELTASAVEDRLTKLEKHIDDLLGRLDTLEENRTENGSKE